MPQICDYEGSKYRTEFWEGQNREYEDRVERVAMKNMLPSTGKHIIEIGAGFGRLADLYKGYEQIILVDYARTQLEEAQDYLKQDNRFIFVVADIYDLPFVNHLFDTLTMVRVMHHLTNVPDALQELHRIIMPNGTAVIEHASKFHLKSIARWLLGRQDWNPFDRDPVEFVELNFDFHPAWMREQFKLAGFDLQNIRTLSHYRVDILKRLVPTNILVQLDGLAQPTGQWWQLTPSIFLQAHAQKNSSLKPSGFFQCPRCKAPLPEILLSNSNSSEQVFNCNNCQAGWLFKDGIYDFKNPI